MRTRGVRPGIVEGREHAASDALRALRDAIDDLGVLVVINGVVGNNTHRRQDVAEFRGFVFVDDYAPQGSGAVFASGQGGFRGQDRRMARRLRQGAQHDLTGVDSALTSSLN